MLLLLTCARPCVCIYIIIDPPGSLSPRPAQRRQRPTRRPGFDPARVEIIVWSLGFGDVGVYTVCARWVRFRNGGAPTYGALASACRPAPTIPTILN